MKEYTQNHWTVSALYKDTIQTAKSVSVPDMDFVHDFKKKVDEPSEAIITNVSGSEISTMETVRYGVSNVNNVYQGTNTELAAQAPTKKGVQILVELTENYRATHATTGEEIDLPCKGRIVLRFPTHACVTEEMVQDLLSRTISSALASGKTDASRLVEVARGSLLPDGI